MGLFGSSDSGDTGFASKLRTSTGSKDLDLSYGNDSLGGQGYNDSAGDMNAQEFANTLQMQGQMAQLFSKVSHDTTLCTLGERKCHDFLPTLLPRRPFAVQNGLDDFLVSFFGWQPNWRARRPFWRLFSVADFMEDKKGRLKGRGAS